MSSNNFRNRVAEHEKHAATKYGKFESRLSLLSRVLFQQTNEIIPGDVPPTWIGKTSDEKIAVLLKKAFQSACHIEMEDEADEEIQGLRLLIDESAFGVADAPWEMVVLVTRALEEFLKIARTYLS